MARTKKPERAKPKVPTSPASVNGPLGEVLTLAETADYLRLSETEVLRLVDEQALPVRRIGNEHRFLKAAIQRWLSRGTPQKPGKAAQLAVAGSWKDDPLVEIELKEAMRRRGRTFAEEGS